MCAKKNNKKTKSKTSSKKSCDNKKPCPNKKSCTKNKNCASKISTAQTSQPVEPTPVPVTNNVQSVSIFAQIRNIIGKLLGR